MITLPVDSRFSGSLMQNFVPIWTPDLYLCNTAEKPMSQIENGLAQVYSDGTVVWLRPGMLKATCEFEVDSFPEDTQHCFLEFSSWAFDAGMLKLKPYAAGGSWNMKQVKYYLLQNAII